MRCKPVRTPHHRPIPRQRCASTLSTRYERDDAREHLGTKCWRTSGREDCGCARHGDGQGTRGCNGDHMLSGTHIPEGDYFPVMFLEKSAAACAGVPASGRTLVADKRSRRRTGCARSGRRESTLRSGCREANVDRRLPISEAVTARRMRGCPEIALKLVTEKRAVTTGTIGRLGSGTRKQERGCSSTSSMGTGMRSRLSSLSLRRTTDTRTLVHRIRYQ